MKAKTLLIVLAMTLALVACKKNPPSVVQPAPVSVAPTESPDDVTAPKAVQDMVANFSRVYFPFDRATLDTDAKAALRSNAEIMLESTDLKVEVQGHADERGTTDYNLALGQKRADAVVRFLSSQGVSPSRLTTISYGEERPLDGSSSEIAWSKNRRAEFRITWGPDSIEGTTD